MLRSQLLNAFSDCDDFCVREWSAGRGTRIFVAYIKGISSRDIISRHVIAPLGAVSDDFAGDLASVVTTSGVFGTASVQSLAAAVAKGDTAVAAENANGFFCCLAATQSSPSRGITEPSSDVTVRGPKAGFNEDAETSMALLRRYIRTPALKFRRFTVGSVSQTNVMMAYCSDRAPEKLVCNIARRISAIKASVITDSANIAMLLEGDKNPVLPSCGSSEKVDKVASKLMSGRVAIIVDGSPFVLTLPFLFAESIQASDDYLHTPYYATFIRILRLFAFFASVFAPAVLCAAVEYDRGAIPEVLYGIIDESRRDIKLPFFWELIAVLLLFELLREVGVRMPRTVGDAVGIVGSIILGNTAVDAGIVSSVGVITVAFAAVCAFITPAFMYIIVLARIGAMVLAAIFGVFGIGLAAVLLFILLAAKKSFGAPFLLPLSPFDKKGMYDFVFAWPKKSLGRKENVGGK